MALILNIDTATEIASVSIAKDGILIQVSKNNTPKEHASFLHVAIQEMLAKENIELKNIDAFVVNCGPGSYTGIRVGMASAKGFCFALDKPFIMINSLELLAFSASLKYNDQKYMYAPMIDARRMEVFTALFDHQIKLLIQPIALILNDHSFSKQLSIGKILFLGSGSAKFRNLINDKNAVFVDNMDTADAMAKLSFMKFENGTYNDLIDAEPLYVKDLYAPES